MVHQKTKYLIPLCFLTLISCKHEPPALVSTEKDNYPEQVAKIIINKCATVGCHNNASYSGAGGLNLSTWDKLFEGGSIGAAVIPYRPDFSVLCYSTNIDTSLGAVLAPTMPVNQPPLSKEEYIILRDWVAVGAPDINGTIKFADNPARKKIYVTNQLCDEVTVFDAETLLQMRYIKVGDMALEEFPHKIMVAPDKKNWYVSFFVTTNIIQKFSAVDDRFIGSVNIGKGNWTSFAIMSDSKKGFFVDNNNPGQVAYVDLEKMTLLSKFNFGGQFRYPLGIAINESLKKLYIGNTSGNYIYTADITDPSMPVIKELIINGDSSLMYNSVLDPGELLKEPGSDICYIACTRSAEIRVMDMVTDKLVHNIPIGSMPAHMAYSASRKLLFVSCPDDISSFPGNRGSVVVIDTKTNTVLKKINTGYQPFGIAADDERQIVSVVNANLSPNGNKPHHASNCIGRNGNVTFIDMNTLELVSGIRSEVAVYPYGTDIR